MSVGTVARNAGRRRIMLDARNITGDLNDFERYELGKRAPFHWGRELAVAIVYPTGRRDKLAQLTARNRGGIVAVVETLEEAALWLAQVDLPAEDLSYRASIEPAG
ncbi:MAG: hypothetical protein H6978_01045 [Gammaproteobacteria bacterium]|nr:hypothetical protein [Gammaproteobacteria bacterium]